MSSSQSAISYLYGAAAFVIVVAGCKLAAPLIAPILLATFLAIIFSPLLLKLRSWRVPTIIALPLLAVPVIALMTLLGLMLQTSFVSLHHNRAEYELEIEKRKKETVALLNRTGLDVSDEISLGNLEPEQVEEWAKGAFTVFSGVVAYAFLVIMLLIIMLLQATGMAEKYAETDEPANSAIGRAKRILIDVRHYLVLKTWISLMTGAATYLLLLFFEVDFPVLWAFLAFLLNYIPNIGSVLAAIPPVILSFIMDGGGTAFGVAMGYLVINVLVGNIIEPLWMGKGVGLSPLAVILSLLFWSWVLGPVGAVLSVPLTMTIKIVLESDDATSRFAGLLGPIKAEATAEA